MLQSVVLSLFGLTDYQIAIILWAILIVVSIVVELITDELTIIWGTVGAIFALIAAALHADVWLQLIIFAVFTVLFILVFRPLIKKYSKKEVIRTNADRIIGKVAVITEPFKDGNIGKATVNSQTWRAVSSSNEEFFEGEKVQIDGISGTKIIVSKINNEKIIKL